MKLSDIEQAIIDQLKPRAYEYPITRKHLAEYLKSQRLMISKDDRPMRLAIEELRKKGYLVCHRKGKDGGYFLAQTLRHYEDFRNREYKSRIISISKTMKMMDKAAELMFDDEIQLELYYL